MVEEAGLLLLFLSLNNSLTFTSSCYHLNSLTLTSCYRDVVGCCVHCGGVLSPHKVCSEYW